MDQTSLNKSLVIAIAGTLPPPIGGVTIHINRLIEHLEDHHIQYSFYSRSVKDLLSLLFNKGTPDIVHIHHSNAFIRWLIIRILSIRKKKTIITIHRDLKREKGIRRYFTNRAIHLTTVPIVLNTDSLYRAKMINDNSRIISSFLPPQIKANEAYLKLAAFIKNSQTIFCTNAYDLAYDKSNQEIYQISQLVDIFSQLDKTIKLIISDPSGNNYNCISKKRVISENILFISHAHDFVDVIKESDCLIRATTTDGDSVSIKEALYFGVNVIASDCVDRPSSCTIYQTNNVDELKDKIVLFNEYPVVKPENAFPEILDLYQTISQLSI